MEVLINSNTSQPALEDPSRVLSFRLVLACLLLFLAAPSCFITIISLWQGNQDPNSLWVLKEPGSGPSAIDAEKAAVRGAIETILKFVHREFGVKRDLKEMTNQVVACSGEFVERVEKKGFGEAFEGITNLELTVVIRRKKLLEKLKELHIETVEILEYPLFHSPGNRIEEIRDGNADAFLRQMDHFFAVNLGVKELVLCLIPLDFRWFPSEWPESTMVLTLVMEICNCALLITLFFLLGSFKSRKERFPFPRWAMFVIATLPVMGVCGHTYLWNELSPVTFITLFLLLGVLLRIGNICPKCRAGLTISSYSSTDPLDRKTERGGGIVKCGECGYSYTYTTVCKRK